MKTEIFTFCDFAQENSGKLNIIGTFDTIISDRFPCVHPMLFVVIGLRFDLWEFTSHSFRIEIRDLEGRSGMEPVHGKLEINETGNGTAVSHLIFTITNLKINNSGVLTFVLYIDDKEISSIPLYINQRLNPNI